jgi:hypothetical protein
MYGEKKNNNKPTTTRDVQTYRRNSTLLQNDRAVLFVETEEKK